MREKEGIHYRFILNSLLALNALATDIMMGKGIGIACILNVDLLALIT